MILRWTDSFIASLRARGYASSTISARRRHLLEFAEWLEAHGIETQDVTLPVLETYRVAVFERRKRGGGSLSWGSQAHRLSAVKCFFAWLLRTGHVDADPAAGLLLPRQPRRLPRAVLTEREVESVLRQPDLTCPIGLRDRAILEVLYSTGVRRGECSRLRVDELDLTRLTVFVREGKGRRDRVVPLGERAARWVDRYLLRSRPGLTGAVEDGWLWLTKRGRRLSGKRLGEAVSRYVAMAPIGKRGACHLFRHAVATLMLDRGADIRHIQELLGHADLSTTAIYAQLSIARLQEVHRRTHPAYR